MLTSTEKDLVDEETFQKLATKFNDTEYNKRHNYLLCSMMYIQSKSLKIVSNQENTASRKFTKRPIHRAIHMYR